MFLQILNGYGRGLATEDVYLPGVMGCSGEFSEYK